ncbi:unnamed protein product [Gongylonema pulchrum]|uniref:Chitin-binding type-2 domain-containing protein n=1 Tax=Gongylonema pulchrum TaxID=637853 RepID=A0A183D7P9_9BILA|nr:unnamed protein product [Gongylonema pulchrum]
MDEQCREGDMTADPSDCTSYAFCESGQWRTARCRHGLFWNQHLRQCDTTGDCEAFKRADCIHGQRLVGATCGEYLECIHGSWITMQCLSGYGFGNPHCNDLPS